MSVNVTEAPVLCDVVLMPPPDETLDTVKLRMKASQMLPQDRLERLFQLLAEKGAARIKADTPRAEAERIAAQYREIGFSVVVKQGLRLVEKSATAEKDNECPSCHRMMIATAEGKCPYCGVILAKIDPAKLLEQRLRAEETLKIQSRLAQDERQRELLLQEQLEKNLRDKIRAELEKQYGLNNPYAFWRGPKAVLRISLISALLVASFFGGHWLATPAPEQALSAEQKAQLAQGILTQIMGKGVVANPAVVNDYLHSASGKALVANDPDSLLQMTASGTASMVPDPAWPQTVASLQKAPGLQVLLSGDLPAYALVEALSASGQIQRASDILEKLVKHPSANHPEVLAARQRIQAWALVWSGAPQTGLPALHQDLDKLADPALRAKQAAALASILANSDRLSRDGWLSFEASANQALSGIGQTAQRTATANALHVQAIKARLHAARQYQSHGLQAVSRILLLDIEAILRKQSAAQAAIPQVWQLAASAAALSGRPAEAAFRQQKALQTLDAIALPADKAIATHALAAEGEAGNADSLRDHIRMQSAQAQSLTPAMQRQVFAELGQAAAALGDTAVVQSSYASLQTLSANLPSQMLVLWQQQLSQNIALARWHQKQGDFIGAEQALRKASSLALQQLV